MFLDFTFSEEVKLGDLLTSVSVLISLLVFVQSWAKDRELRKREQADRIRSAASQTLAKLQRWQELSIWLYQQAQPIYVEASEMLQKKYDVYKTRDFLWKKLEETQTSTLSRVLEEQIEIAYVDLFAYHPAVYGIFADTMTRLKALETEVFNRLIIGTQKVVLDFDKRRKEYRTELLGNALRAAAQRVQEDFKSRSDIELNPIREFLMDLINQTDDKMLRKSALTEVAVKNT